MNRTAQPKLEKTTNYGLFELHPCNRSEKHDKKLAESMRQHGFIPSGAIHVRPNGNGKYKVIRGHHRLVEAKRQRLPVYYIVDTTDVNIFDLEGSSHSSWSSQDFVIAYARSGNKDYARLLEYFRKHGIPIQASASLVGGESAGSTNMVARIKAGTFKVGDMKHANDVATITDTCRELGIEFATTSSFVGAVSAVSRVESFDPERLLSKIRLHPRMLNKRARRDEYLEEIEAIYNYAARGKKLPLAFMAREAMASRSACHTATADAS